MKIAVDAMGGDYAPAEIMEGVALALHEFRETKELNDLEIILVGHRDKLAYYLEKYHLANNPKVHLHHADSVVEMSDSSTAALRGKKDSSITAAAMLASKGEADGIVSAGHTGAAVAATTVKVRTLPGIERPAIATIMPAFHGRFILVDAGANTDCKPRNLAQFALMGEAYSRFAFGLKNPRIGLLSVGDEDVKGNDLTRETFKLLSEMPINFIGNIEGNDVFQMTADVVVCDGFVGNVLLKSSESLAQAMMGWLSEAFKKNAFRKTGAILARNAFRELKAIGDFEEYGGAPLLGLKSVCIIGHGSSSKKAVKNAIKVAGEFIRFGIGKRITERIEESGLVIE